jgi:hypothetical protein
LRLAGAAARAGVAAVAAAAALRQKSAIESISDEIC